MQSHSQAHPLTGSFNQFMSRSDSLDSLLESLSKPDPQVLLSLSRPFHMTATLSTIGKCIYFRVSWFHDPRCQEFPVLLNARSPMSQFTDMVPYMLALLAKLLTQVTTISQDCSLISCWVFRLSNAEMYASSGFVIH
jgi:hypothetical protein